jgi:DNA-binding XRE family transcriptional regulator
MSESVERIPEAIRALRKHCAMTQVEFAAALHVAPASIHRWEAGTSSPEFEMIVSLWSFAIEHGSATSKYFAEFLASRTDAIRPLFDAAQLPAVQALDKQIASLAVDQRQLVLAFIEMLKQNADETADRVIRLLLEPWKQTHSENQNQNRRAARADQARGAGSKAKKK